MEENVSPDKSSSWRGCTILPLRNAQLSMSYTLLSQKVPHYTWQLCLLKWQIMNFQDTGPFSLLSSCISNIQCLAHGKHSVLSCFRQGLTMQSRLTLNSIHQSPTSVLKSWDYRQAPVHSAQEHSLFFLENDLMLFGRSLLRASMNQ